MNIYRRSITFMLASASLTSASNAEAAITGAGSTFVYPVLSRWAADYKKAGGDEINYQSIGSGGGISQVKAGTVDFGATDKPLASEELAASGLAQFPVVIGGVVPVINIPGAHPGQVKMSGPVLAAIYAGEIKNWNDPRIAKLNPGLHFPAKEITPIHRSDGSGTTFNFTDYLAKVSADWKSKVGSATAVEWPVGVGAKGNDGVANNVMQTRGAIGYVEHAYAKQNKLSHTRMVNAAGKVVAPESASFSSAAAKADWAGTPGYGVILSNQAGGVLGGISTGQPITARVAFKPTSSILTPRRSLNEAGEEIELRTKGRHDPCVGLRAVPVVEAMVACVLADAYLRHRGQTGKG